MFCIAFGLSMDYEVFLLSRIKEEHDRTGDNDDVGRRRPRAHRPHRHRRRRCCSRSCSSPSPRRRSRFIKLFGIGLTLAVLMDAFVIRGTLVPAFMRLAGEANWWAPAPLRRLHDRIGVHEDGSGVTQPAEVRADSPEKVADRQDPSPQREAALTNRRGG